MLIPYTMARSEQHKIRKLNTLVGCGGGLVAIFGSHFVVQHFEFQPLQEVTKIAHVAKRINIVT